MRALEKKFLVFSVEDEACNLTYTITELGMVTAAKYPG